MIHPRRERDPAVEHRPITQEELRHAAHELRARGLQTQDICELLRLGERALRELLEVHA